MLPVPDRDGRRDRDEVFLGAAGAVLLVTVTSPVPTSSPSPDQSLSSPSVAQLVATQLGVAAASLLTVGASEAIAAAGDAELAYTEEIMFCRSLEICR